MARHGVGRACCKRAAHHERERGFVKSHFNELCIVILKSGTVSGKPFGDGRIKLVVQLDFPTQTATGTFRIRDDRGTAFGTVDMTFAIDLPGNAVDFTGTADFTGGKGRYKGIRGRDLKAHDHNTLDGQNGEIELKGFASW